MFKNPKLSVMVLFLLTAGVCLANLNIDFGELGQPVKSGFLAYSGNHNNEAGPFTYDVDGQSITVHVTVGGGSSGYREYGGEPLGADMVYPDSGTGPVDGRVILTLSNLPAGAYSLKSYHNDSKDTHDQQDPINVTVSGNISSSTPAINVTQTKSLTDEGLGNSTVTFTTGGTGEVFVTYTPTTNSGLVSKAVLNGFELTMPDQGEPYVEFDSAASSDLETVTSVSIPVVISHSTSEQVTVNYSVAGTASNTGDHDLTAGVLTFAADQSAPEYITFNVVSDGVGESDETVVITLSGPVNAQLGSNSQHTYTIIDPKPDVSFEQADSYVFENGSVVSVAVRLSQASALTVTVDYLIAGTAENGIDYTISPASLVFAPGEQTKTIHVQPIDDDYVEEPDDTVILTLANPQNANLGDIAEHTMTILAPKTQLCPLGDMTGDCEVTLADLEEFVDQWLDPSGICAGYDCADIDQVNGVQMSDYALLAENWEKSAFPVVVNEVMASNNSTLEDPDEAGEYPDWIELYNGSPLPVNLGGLYLTDDLDDPTKWQIPGGVTIAPYSYLLFYADDDDEQGPTHTSYKLGATGDDIGLFGPDGEGGLKLLSGFSFGQQESDISYGRYPNAGTNLRFLSEPTPMAENSGAFIDAIEDTKFSHDRGFYDAAFDLSIACDTGGAEIHYTLDGSEPSEFVGGNTYLYSTPINISQSTVIRAAAFKPGYLPSSVDTQSYFFLDDVVTQPVLNPGVTSGYTTTTLRYALTSIPTLSIAINADDLANLQAQDSRNPETKEELPCSAELIYSSANDGEGFQVNCAIEGHSWAISKRSYKLIFKTPFGPSQLDYPLFESAPVNAESAVDHFDRIVLRASKNMEVTYPGDQWTRDSQIAMSGIGSHGTFFHLYLNGTYWGIYNATERPDASFTSSYLGGEKEDYFATNHGIERGEDHISGDSTRFDTLINMARTLDMTDPNNYELFKQYCDVTNFADYTIIFWFSGFGDNIDNNWYAGMRNVPLEGSVPPEGFMMFMWDAEAVFQPAFTGPPGHEVPWVPSYYFTMTGYTIVDIWNALYQNADFRMLFADRVYKHCFNDGALEDNEAEDRWDNYVNLLDRAAIFEQARWGKGLPPEEMNMNEFVDIFINALKTTPYSAYKLYPDTVPPEFSIDGGEVPANTIVTMTKSSSYDTIYYTLDGSDPREPGTGNVAGVAYAGGLTLNQSVQVKARSRSDTGEWSPLAEAIFAVGPLIDSLRITEIMYNCGDANDPNQEYIEIKNVGPTFITLNLVSFTGGIEYTFHGGFMMPGQHLLLVKDRTSFVANHPSLGGLVVGQYTGRLDNNGETIKLVDAIGRTIQEFRYDDDWRSITDGGGYSLTIVDPTNSDLSSWSRKDSWRPSAYIGGSPGTDDSGILPNPGDLVINEVMAHSHLAPDWIELHNTSSSQIDLSGWYLSDNNSDLTRYRIADGTVLEPDGDPNSYIVFYQDIHFGNASDPGSNTVFALSENGEQVFLTSPLDGNGDLTGFRKSEDFGASETGVSFGRYYKASTGTSNFVFMETPTPKLANSDPNVGPIVINEIMYHPDWPAASLYSNEDYEFIELYNITGSPINLFNEDGLPWKFTDGIDFTFPASTVIPAYGYAIICSNTEAFTARYGALPPSVELFEYDGKLSNSGEKLELSMPGDIDLAGKQYYIRVDRVVYSDGSHPEDNPGDVDLWPVSADGGGMSLTRIIPGDYGNDPANFQAVTPSPATP